MDRIKADSRFSHVLSDPRFRGVPKQERKVKIDKRFNAMFKDEKFKLKYTVDKRGRPVNHTTTEDLKKFYELSSESSSDEASKKDSADEEEDENSDDSDLRNRQENEDDDEAESVDLARGEGNIESSDSDEESSEDDDNEKNEEGYHPWGELDTGAPEATEITHRLAVCNMNWDRIKAHDLLLLFNSFKPSTGIIKSVKIYPTEFGKQRMKEDDIKGPHELVAETVSDSEEEAPEGSKFHMEKLRKYQINRLKYYYAVLECDTPETANKIYEECDGVEYESSATRLDLRFIPDSMTFDEEPHSVADTLTKVDNYRPNLFTTTALQQAKVDLTWDETDPNRIQATQDAFNKKDLDNVDLKAYLASGSEDENEAVKNEEEETIQNDSDDLDAINNNKSNISKYRELLKSIEEEEKKKSENDVQMEITWEPGLREAAEEIVKKKEAKMEELTPWEEYLKKKKEKKLLKKKKRLEQQQLEKNNESGNQESLNPYSDDELPSDVDLNDKFFRENLNSDVSKKEKKKKKNNRKKNEAETDEDKQKKAELELLLMDDDDNTRHFHLDDLIQDEQREKRKKKQKKKEKLEDDFKMDLKDPRFSALYSSHLYNVDPSDHHFKRTKGMEAIIEEKQRRRINEEDRQSIRVGDAEPDHSNYELSALIKSIKRKSSNLYKKNKKNKK